MIPFAEYRKIEAVNFSTLRELGRSPLHYRHRLENQRADTPALSLGRAVHSAVFEPDRFPLEYAVRPAGIDRRTKDGKAAAAEFEAANVGRTVLDLSEYARCLAIRDAVRRNPHASAYLERGEPEYTIQWQDAITGLACKGRIDYVSDSRPAIVDLKTSRSIDARLFAATAARYGYHNQLAFYHDGYHASVGPKLPVVIVAVESEPPFDCGVFRVEDDELYCGQAEYRRLLDKLAFCRARDEWPGRYAKEQRLTLPAWAFADDTDNEEGMSDAGL